MRIFHVVRDLDLASGGPSRSVPALARYQALSTRSTVSVYFGYSNNPSFDYQDDSVNYFDLSAFRGDLSVDDGCSRIVHLHGLWTPSLHYIARFVLRNKVPYVVSPRGMLSEWCLNHKAVKKAVGWWLYQERDLINAEALIASSQLEEQDIRRKLDFDVKVELIPNGCEMRVRDTHAPSLLQKNTEIRWALFLGRIHPVKGLEELLYSWAAVNSDSWKLALVGPDENGYREKLKTLAEKLGIANLVEFHDQCNDEEKWAYMRDSEILIVPSRSENFGMTIAEGLQAGLPVITTIGTPWSELEERGCGWWVKHGVDQLARAIHEATLMTSEQLNVMGRLGRDLIQERYSWESVASRSIEVYKEVIVGLTK